MKFVCLNLCKLAAATAGQEDLRPPRGHPPVPGHRVWVRELGGEAGKGESGEGDAERQHPQAQAMMVLLFVFK